MSLALRTTKKTIQRKILFMADCCDEFHRANMSRWKRRTKPRFQMDEMETFEERHGHTIKVPLIVEKESHFIVSAAPLRDWSRSQYPPIKKAYNEKHVDEIRNKRVLFKAALKTCRIMKPAGRIVMDTDKHLQYPALLKETFGDLLVHAAWDAKDDSVKMEMFPVNNTMACLRSDVASVRKRSWHISHAKYMLAARLKIYTFYSNYLKKKSYRQGSKRVEMTPAMHLGISKKPVVEVY